MSKKILIERNIGTLNYIKESASPNGSNRIGRLEGIGADFKNPTRNGRKYPLELWRNVEASSDFKEGMETLTIFGENDHPETRVDASLKLVSMVLTDFEIRESEGVVFVGFDILPTEEGYKLKAILDYGSKIGVSSRGLGDEIEKNGENIIDPDTYVFYGFDAVVMPAVMTARPTVVESTDRAKVADKFKSDVESATTREELNALMNVADVMKLPELDSLKESINIKLDSLTEGDNISSKLEADLGALGEENEKLREDIEILKSKVSASNTRLKEAKDVISNIRKSLSKEQSKNRELESTITRLQSDNKSISNRFENLKQSYKANSTRLEKATRRIELLSKESSNSAETIANLTEELNSNKSKCKEYESKISNLNSRNSKLVNSLKKTENSVKALENSKKLTESSNANITNKLAESNKQMSEVLDKYVKSRCMQEGLDYNQVITKIGKNYTSSEADKIITEMADQNRRLSKVPVSLTKMTAVVSGTSQYDPETEQTLRFLQESLKN